MIKVEHLSRKYGDHYAVADVSFTAEPGRIYGFLGPNGAGKSTTMNMMTGYLAPTKGTVLIDGEDIMKEPEAARARIGYLPEIPPVYADMTVREYLAFAAQLRKVPRRERGEAVRRAMQAADVESVSTRLIRNLSKGYKQRVGLAQAIIADPPIIILDEPTAGLDPEQQREMFDYIRALKKDHTIILSSHILTDVSAVCDYVWILNEGRLVASDTPANLQQHMTTSQTIKVTVMKCDADAFKAALEAVPHVRKVTICGASSEALNAAIATDTVEDIRPQISQTIFGAGMTILSMTQEEKSLEEVFLSLTRTPASKTALPESIAAGTGSGKPEPEDDGPEDPASKTALPESVAAGTGSGKPEPEDDGPEDPASNTVAPTGIAAGTGSDESEPANHMEGKEDSDAGNL